MSEKNIQQVSAKQKVVKAIVLIGLYAFLGIMALIVLFPFYWMIISSLKTLDEYRMSVPTFWPQKIMFSNYAEAFTAASLGRLFVNTLYVGVVSTLLSLVITVLSAFAFARLEFKGKNALFAALLGIGALAKEEKDKTAEFLLTHPISRTRVVTEKLLAVLAQLLAMNVGVVAVTLLAILAVGVEANTATVLLLFLANLLMQIEIAAVTFGISAFLHGNGLGIGLGLAFGLYFLQILSNLIDGTKFLKFITPFSYTDGSYIVAQGKLEVKYLFTGLALALVGVAAALWQYRKKDIAS